MADPLGLIQPGGGGIGGPGGLTGPGGMTPRPGAANASGPSFKDVLMDSLKQVNSLQQEATTAAEDLATGKRNDVEGALMATQKADMAFKMLLSVRNKVEAAYEEIKQLRV